MVLHTTQSICPICHRPLTAYYVAADDRVYFIKTCPQHGTFQTTVAEHAEDYQQWVKHPVINIAPKAALTCGDPQDQSCPLHCGTCENHLQTACCVLIDVTNRCNQHCPYCFAESEADVSSIEAAASIMPTGSAENMSSAKLGMDATPANLAENAVFADSAANIRRCGEPTLAEIEKKYDLLLELGEERPFNIQLSGGEPTIREDLPQMIAMAREKGFSYVQINSNGRRLAQEEDYAKVLKDAGASVIFMQFDGTRDDIYETLRGEPLLENKKKAIQNCEKAGLPVTLVPTIVEGVNTDNIGEIMDFALEHINVVKGIHFQPVSFFGRHPEIAAGGGSGFGNHADPANCRGSSGKGNRGCGGCTGKDENEVFTSRANGENETVTSRADASGKGRNEDCNGRANNVSFVGDGKPIRTGDFPGRVTMFGLLRELEAQRPDFKYEHFCPIATGHTLCCFYSTYIKEPDGSVRCTLTNAQKEAGVSCCDVLPSRQADRAEVCKNLPSRQADRTEARENLPSRQSDDGSASAGGRQTSLLQQDSGSLLSAGGRSLPQIDRAEVIRRDRDFVLNKWEVASADETADLAKYKSSREITALDDFLRYYRLNSFTVTGMAFQDASNLDAERLKRCRVQVLSEDNKLIPFCAYNSIYRKE